MESKSKKTGLMRVNGAKKKTVATKRANAVEPKIVKEVESKEKKTSIGRKKFLPVGSVVLLKGARKRLMVNGFCISDKNDKKKKIWDYSGCLYPEGIIEPNQMFLFDHKQIEKIYFVGFENNAEEKKFKTKLIEMYKKIKSK